MARALVRPPSPRLADGIVTHIERQPVDAALAMHQWHEYVRALRASEWDVIQVPRADDCPDGVFVEDAVVMFGDLALLTRPGDPRRRAEVGSIGAVVRGLSCEVRTIDAPGTLDGGDVLKVGDTVYVGLGGRTNEAGIAQLAAHVEPLGLRVVPVPVTRVLHLKSAVTALPDGTVIGWDPAVDDAGVFPTYLSMPEEPGAHVVLLGGDRVLMAHDAPASAALLRDRGVDVVCVDIGEYQKLEGCVTCLSVRMRAR